MRAVRRTPRCRPAVEPLPQVRQTAPRPLRPGRGPGRRDAAALSPGASRRCGATASSCPSATTAFKLCLGEGFTPLLRTVRLEREVGHGPSTSRTRGSTRRARSRPGASPRRSPGPSSSGSGSVSIPTAGNAGCAMSAYAALARPRGPRLHAGRRAQPFINECRVLGAQVTLIDGLITDCGKAARKGVEKHGWFDVSTLKEPYRIEGKKTMGYEVAEQMGWRLPDVIIYPTGGGTGLVGMWKAFDEMEKLGWIGPKRPRMVTVQSDGCAPMVKAFQRGEGIRRALAERPDDRRRHAGPGRRGRLPHPAGAPRERRHGRGRSGRRDPRGDLSASAGRPASGPRPRAARPWPRCCASRRTAGSGTANPSSSSTPATAPSIPTSGTEPARRSSAGPVQRLCGGAT